MKTSVMQPSVMNPTRLILSAITALLCILLFLHARQQVWSPDFLPGWDGSGYVLRGVRVHDALLAGDLEKLGELLVRPDIRPPLFPFLLGLFCMVAGTDVTVGTTWAQLCFFLSLASLPLIGRLALGERGWIPGLAAALLTALGLDHLALVMTPMSESTTLLCTLLTTAVLLRAAPSPGLRSSLAIGLAILAAALVRYNLPVMMGVPLVAWHIWESVSALRARPPAQDGQPPEAPRRLFQPDALLWFAPTALTFGVWYALRPTLGDQIEKFLVNRSSGLEFWSVKNLLFFPLAVERSFLGLPGWALIGLFFIGLPPLLAARPLERAFGGWTIRLASTPALRLLQLQSLAAIAALTLHDYKLDRNLYASLPALYLCALLPLQIRAPAALSASPLRRAPAALAAALLAALTGWQAATGIPTLPDRYHMEGDPGIHAALDFITRHADKSPRLWITGTNDSLSPPLIELWLRNHATGSEPRLITRSEALTERTRTGIDPAWSEKYRAVIDDEFLTDKEIGRTTWICIETLPGSRRFKGGQRWTNYQNNYARAFSEQTRVPLLSKLTLPEAGIQLSSYGAATPGGAAAPGAPARPAGRAPAEAPTPAAAFYEETFDSGGTGWGLFPEREIPPEGVFRQDGLFRVTIVLPTKLQLCGPVIPAPAEFVARWEFSAGRMEGRPPVLQLRGVDEAGALLKRADGTAQIHRIGPVRLDGAQALGGTVQLDEGTANVKPCVILEGVSGEFTLDRLVLGQAR